MLQERSKMHKLVMIIEPIDDWQSFENAWPRFLHLAESMPGVRMESTSRVEHMLYGGCRVGQVHEFYFDSLLDAENAMASPQGQAAGRVLQQITAGHLTIYIADHKEDTITNIQKYQSEGERGD
jgi:uncharacterized protein (TIGR02118 family)